MTGNTNIARPYAVAAFEQATAKNAVGAWGEMLRLAASFFNDKQFCKLLINPQLTQEQLTTLFVELLADKLDAERKNFIRLLGQYQRLNVLPEIAALFEEYRLDQEKKIKVEVLAATPLTENYLQKISQQLTKRFQRQVILESKVDPTLIAGAIIRAGDTVIDGTVRGKLTRLFESL